jgi:hypothetical protein
VSVSADSKAACEAFATGKVAELDKRLETGVTAK